MSEKDRKGTSWEGSPLRLRDGIDPCGIREVVVEFHNGDVSVGRPRQRDEFGSYELEQMAVVLGTAANQLRRNADMELWVSLD